MSTQAKRWIAVAIIALALVLAWRPLSDFLAVDSCLDSGGRYDYDTDACDHGPDQTDLAG